MDNAFLRAFEGVADPLKNGIQSLIEPALDFAEVRFKGLSFHILHRNIGRAIDFPDIVNRNHIRMIDRCRYLCLSKEVATG